MGRGELGSPVWPRATICISSQSGGQHWWKAGAGGVASRRIDYKRENEFRICDNEEIRKEICQGEGILLAEARCQSAPQGML